MKQMEAHVYELHGQIYRRNVPLEQISQVKCASDVLFSDIGDEDEYNVSCEPPTVDVNENTELDVGIEELSFVKVTSSNFIKYDEKKKIYYSKLEIPAQMIGFVIGTKGKHLQSIQISTGAKVKVPKRSAHATELIEIYGDAVDKVEHARDLLELSLMKARQRCPPSHFVSFPLMSDVAFCAAYADLVARIRGCTDIPEQYRSEDIFRPVEKIHFTACVLRLFTEEDERIAKNCLSEFVEQEMPKLLSETQKLTVSFSGLDFFGTSKSKARVVYAKAESDILQKAANLIDEKLTKVGLASKRKTPEVVLHMTILNAKPSTINEVDATELLARFERFQLPPVDITELRICVMHEVDPYTNGHPTIFCTHFV